MDRCKAFVFTATNKKYRFCKNKAKYVNFCTCHAKKFAIIIQNSWKKYRAKKRFNIFKKLPEDVWSIVLKFITANDEIKIIKYYEKIYTNRIKKIYFNYKNTRSIYLDHNILYSYIEKRQQIRDIINNNVY